MTSALAKEIKGNYTKTGGSDILAFHMIQSFSPYDKLTPQEAHEIGKKWADEILQGKYEYVISTHVDKGHIHNHIIFNSVSFYDHKKYETKPYKTAALLRNVSDRLCAENGLYVIQNPNLNQKSASHYEWEQRKAGTSWKEKIREIIDKAISECTDYDSFKKVLTDNNVEIKEGKRISFRIIGTGQERFCRGDRIGENYSKESILKRLIEPKKEKEIDTTVNLKAENQKNISYDKRIEWEARRTKLAATKELAAVLRTLRAENIQHESDFDVRVNDLHKKTAEVREVINQLSSKNQQYKKAAKYLISINKYLPVKLEYESKTGFKKKKYEAAHEGELQMYDHAAEQLTKMGVDLNVDVDKVMGLISNQEEKINTLSAELKGITSKVEELKKAQQIINNIKNGISSPEEQKGQPKKNQKDILL